MRIVLIRHGQTASNLKGLLDTAMPGAELTALGRRQAAALPDALVDVAIDAIFTSPLIRTRQTARPLADSHSLPLRELEGLREISAGEHEMAGDEESKRNYVETALSWSDGGNERLFGAETGVGFLARFDAAINEVVAVQTRTSIVVSHGAAIRCWVAARVQGVTSEYAREHTLSNTGAVIIERTDRDAWRLIKWVGQALGGSALTDLAADDPTGKSV